MSKSIEGVSLAAIREHHLFAGLSPAQLQLVFAASRIEEAEAGQVLFDRGQPAQHFFIVVDGQVNLVLYSKAGEEKIVDILGPGKSFAEAVMFMEGAFTRFRLSRPCARASRDFRTGSTSHCCAKVPTPAFACWGT